jgi:SAM-dependent methyltransferase
MHVSWIHTAVLRDQPSRVLDLACGPGLYLNRLAERRHHGTGIDFSPASIEYARQVAGQANLDVTYVEGDLRTTDFGSGFDLVMLLYGQLNVFQRPEATDIIHRATQALNPGGTLIIEPQTYDHVKESGLAKPVWTSHPTGLFSPNPHLLLTESFWHEESGSATQRFYVVDASSGDVARHAMTNEAYTDGELMSLLADQGLTAVTDVGPLPGSTGDNAMTVLVGHAAESA